MGGHRRFLINPKQINQDIATLEGGLARQISKVLRLRQGERICLLDGTGMEYDAEITALSKELVTARIVNAGKCSNEPGLHLVLAVCIPKSDKLELIVQKCTELGISEVIIAHSERTISKFDGDGARVKMERWNRIACEAAEQCGRAAPPVLTGVIPFGELIGKLSSFPLSLVAWEEESGVTLKDALREHSDARSAALLIGPEGGLTEKEVDAARNVGAICVSLGKRVLRCETAAIAACSAIMYELEGEL